MTFNLERKSKYTFKRIKMNEKTEAKYPKLCVTVELILLAFPNFYMVVSGFSHVHYLLSKQKYFEHITWWFVAHTHKPATKYS